MKIEFKIENLERSNSERFEKKISSLSGVNTIVTWKGGCEIDVENESIQDQIVLVAKEHGFNIQMPFGQTKTFCVSIDGMTCRSCEIIVEKKFKEIPGIKQVDVNVAKGTAKIVCDKFCHVGVLELQKSVQGDKYSVREFVVTPSKSVLNESKERLSFARIAGLFVLVYLLGTIFEKLGLFQSQTSVQGSMTWAAAIVLGLVAGSSSCLAVSGGLLLSSVGKYRERYGNATILERLRPVFLFVGGRVVAYSFMGGLIGFIGKSVSVSPVVTGGITILAAVYMLIMGLEMLHLAPAWLLGWLPRMPKSISHHIVGAQGNTHWAAPFLLGGATFFLPCGFTQSLQVYALTTGSFFKSAIILGGFAIGTAPALLALGWASSSLKGNVGKFFLQFSGALVIVLGLINIQNGLTIIGFSIPSFSNTTSTTTTESDSLEKDPNVTLEGNTQLIKLRLINSSPYYTPSNIFTVKSGQPVRIQIDGVGTGCRSVFQITKLGISEYLNQPQTVIDFTPEKPGRYTFSCSMGMYPGVLQVL